ncbi:MAG: amidohydrolase family protein [Euryarchaeota archaeon]|nr:amidohydrolase family protein [Euryarchaeota archaeon]
MIRILIKNATILTMNINRDIIKNGAIAINENRILDVGSTSEIEKKYSADKIIDAQKKIVLPGLINTHTHLSMTLLRGYADDMPLKQWLEEKIWPLEQHLTAEDCYIGALLGCLEMIKSGTTCFADMYYHLENVARAVEQSGLRADLCYPLLELGDPNRGEKLLGVGTQAIKSLYGMANDRIHCSFGPHATNTCSAGLLQKVKKLADELKVNIHIHVSETKGEFEQFKTQYGKTPVEYLQDLNFLGANVLAAHCVWLSDNDIKLLKETNTKVAHNPTSNMKLASGIAPVPKLLASGVTVGLGTDSCASNNNLDMFGEMKMAALAHKVNSLDPTLMPAQKVLEMATINGAKVLGLKNEIGSIEPNKKADLIIVNASKPNWTPLFNPYSNLVYSAHGDDVETVIVNGEILMENRRVETISEQKIIEEAQKKADDLVKRSKLGGK